MGNMVKETEENKMSMEFIAIISVGATMLGVGVALAGLIITGSKRPAQGNAGAGN